MRLLMFILDFILIIGAYLIIKAAYEEGKHAKKGKKKE